MTDPHLGYILGAYGVTIAVVLGLIGWIVIDHRRQSALIADLEARGVRRRSAGKAGATRP